MNLNRRYLVFNFSYKKAFFDIIGLSGIMSLSYGLYLVYKPLSFIIIGALFVVAAVKGNK